MKTLAVFFLSVFSCTHSTSYAQQRIPVFELHASVNHPLGGTRTFYGGGLGANIFFWDERKVSFKTGFETNFFHTWNEKVYVGHMASSTNVHYNFWNLSIPVMLRVSGGERSKFFLEVGGYLGIPLAGTSTSRYRTTPTGPNKPFIDEIRTESIGGYFSLSPAVSLGGIFPISRRIDLISKPEFVFQKNFDVYDGPSPDFNESFCYIRLCLGIRINPNNELE